MEDLAKLMRSIEDEDLTLTVAQQTGGGGGVVTEGECSKFISSTLTDVYKKGQSVEDLAKLMRSIEDEDLTLTGRDKQGGGG